MSKMDLTDICRACKAHEIGMTSIFTKTFGPSIDVMFMAITSLNPQPEDRLPSQICKYCLMLVEKSYAFRQQVIQTDNEFRMALSRDPGYHSFKNINTLMKYQSDLLPVNVKLEVIDPQDEETSLSELNVSAEADYSLPNRFEVHIRDNMQAGQLQNNGTNQKILNEGVSILKTSIMTKSVDDENSKNKDGDQVAKIEANVNDVIGNDTIEQITVKVEIPEFFDEEEDLVLPDIEENDLDYLPSAKIEKKMKMKSSGHRLGQPKKIKTDDKNDQGVEENFASSSPVQSPQRRQEHKIRKSAVSDETLPDKSKERYEQKYSAYCTWRSENGARQTNENVLIAYLTERSKVINPASLWAEHSMLKTMIKLRENVDVKQMHNVQGFMKRNSKNYTPKKSRTLTHQECMQFLKGAPDDIYLMMKAALIIGIYGACRKSEMTNLEVEHLQICDDYLVVTIQQPNNLSPRTFTVPNSIIDGIQMAELVKRYISLRPAHTPHKRLFLFYAKGKCTTSPVGINTFAKMAAKIAQYLNLPEAKLYTGHCFRRTSATLLANEGSDLISIKEGSS